MREAIPKRFGGNLPRTHARNGVMSTVKRRFSVVLIVLLLVSALAAPPVVAPAHAKSWWQIDLTTLTLIFMCDGDPDTPDFAGAGYEVYDKDGKPVQVDHAWLMQVLSTTFGNWLVLI